MRQESLILSWRWDINIVILKDKCFGTRQLLWILEFLFQFATSMTIWFSEVSKIFSWLKIKSIKYDRAAGW